LNPRRQSIKRGAPPRRKRSRARRGRVRDKAYLGWMAAQFCLVSGRRGVTVHHVRRHGEPKNDRRTVPLMAEFHMYEFGRYSVERLGKERFEEYHGVDLEAAIVKYNARYGAEHGSVAS